MSDNTEESSRIGKGMIFLTWIVGLGGLAYFFNDAVEFQENPNQNPEVRQFRNLQEVVLKRNKFGHYVVSGLINQTPVVFLLDTGATSVAIPEAVAREIGLKKGRSHYVTTANGTATAYDTRIDSITIGNITLDNVSASITPTMEGDAVLLGMSALKQIEFTQRGDELILRY